MSGGVPQISHKTLRRYNFVTELDTDNKVCLWWWARFGRRVLFFEPGGIAGKSTNKRKARR